MRKGKKERYGEGGEGREKGVREGKGRRGKGEGERGRGGKGEEGKKPHHTNTGSLYKAD